MSDNLVPFWEKSYQEYDTLHFVAKNGWKRFINNVKEYTNTGGIHII